MPRNPELRSVLIIGSGPIVIGQACEFDYSGTQACKALREEGIRVILVNSNPATIMTDPDIADVTYIEPLTAEFVEKIIARERPDALLPTMGGQTGLNIAVELAEKGVLQRYGVRLIGSTVEAIRKAEDRLLFQQTIAQCGLETPRGVFVHSLEEGLNCIEQIGFPAILRPSFTLGGTGGGIAYNMEEYRELLQIALDASPIRRVLVEESVLGWKEYELEVMRDRKDNAVIVCSIENFDPMGVHTGDSITVAPAQTLTDAEYQAMRDAALRVIRAIGVETGGSNIQFAVHPQTGRMLVIEANPRVSRSSALASKATGFPIAKIAAKLAIGYTLDELLNDITRKTPACFEPAIDYVVVKIPRWDFEKFPEVPDELGTQMKSVGEAMAFGRTFKEALQKALRSLEQGRYGFGFDRPEYLRPLPPEELEALRARLRVRHSRSIFDLCDALRCGLSTEEIHRLTGYDPWFIEQYRQIVQEAQELIARRAQTENPLHSLSAEELSRAKALGFSDVQLAVLTGSTEAEVARLRARYGIRPVYKTVDTCAAEFESSTPYHYSTYAPGENEASPSRRPKVVILGSGPNRIGQGIEFDYCCVHGIFTLRRLGYEAIMVNCNPETVSTDYDIADKLYFEPLTAEDVLNVLEHERPDGVIVSLGGQTPLKLAHRIQAAGFRILGTSPEGIDLAEDRQRFAALLERLGIPCPPWDVAFSEEEAVRIAARIGYPVLVRPSYVLGGRAMQICYREDSLRRYIRQALEAFPERPVLVDRFLENAYEFDVDAVSDGETTLIAGVLQHIEEAGIHSGDSTCVLPPYNITHEQLEALCTYTRQIARELGVVGLLNVQFAMQNGVIYVLEANPRASRTMPFVAKATNIPIIELAVRAMLGERFVPELLQEFRLDIGRVAVKESVFPFRKFPHSRVFPGPEMRSTGEVMGIDTTFGKALIKAHIAAGNRIPLNGGRVFISLADYDKTPRAVEIARGFLELGFELWATRGTAEFLARHGLPVTPVRKHYEGRPSIIDYITDGKVDILINTPLGENARYDEHIMGRTAMRYRIPFFTTLAAAAASLNGLRELRNAELNVKPLQEYYAE